MTESKSQRLLGHLFDALEDDEREWVEERLKRDEEFREEYLQWRRRLAPLEALRPDYDPPPGLAARTCRFVAASMPVPADPPSRRRRMSAVLALPGRISRPFWADVAAVAILAIGAAALLLPAVPGKPSSANRIAVQAGLQSFGALPADGGHSLRLGLVRSRFQEQWVRAGAPLAGLMQIGLFASTPEAPVGNPLFPQVLLPAATSLPLEPSPGAGLAAGIAPPCPSPPLNEPQFANTASWAGLGARAASAGSPSPATLPVSTFWAGAAESSGPRPTATDFPRSRKEWIHAGLADIPPHEAHKGVASSVPSPFRLISGDAASIVLTGGR